MEQDSSPLQFTHAELLRAIEEITTPPPASTETFLVLHPREGVRPFGNRCGCCGSYLDDTGVCGICRLDFSSGLSVLL